MGDNVVHFLPFRSLYFSKDLAWTVFGWAQMALTVFTEVESQIIVFFDAGWV
jgi:hypothetical protein